MLDMNCRLKPVGLRVAQLWCILGLTMLLTATVNAQQWLDDPGQLGHYAIGHTSYQFVDKDAGNRPVAISVWYPANAGNIHSSSPPAQYLTDPYSVKLPTTASTDWEKLGYDRAYEAPTSSNDGPFPLLMVSPGWGCDNWCYIFIGTRLASHGYVVAVIDHWADGQWSWSLIDDLLTVMVHRPRDVSFAITQLLAKSATRGELLFRAIDPERIAASGHSIGGYATYTLAGGDDSVCDALWPVVSGSDSLPYPANTCVPTPPDPRIKTIISLDGSSQLLRYRELARVSVPSLIMGETPDQSEAMVPDLRDWIARPHAAIDRHDSYRVDVSGANHYSFTNYCDAVRVWFNLGWISSAYLAANEDSWPCATTGSSPPPATISAADAHEVVTKYMISLLDISFAVPKGDHSFLTKEYALSHTPTVQFFDSEECHAALPDDSYFTYRPYQFSSECDVAQKDTAGWFSSQSASSNSDPMRLTPAPGGRFRLPKKPF